MLAVIRSFMAVHQFTDVTVVGGAGMVLDANQQAIDDAGLSLILGTMIPEMPYLV